MNSHSEPEKDEEQSRKQLAAAYSFLSKLSDSAFEALLGSETTLPPEYEKEVQRYSSTPIQQRIAAWRRNVSIESLSNKPNVAQQFGEALEQVVIRVKQLLSEFRIESFVAAHLGEDTADTEHEALRIVPLADWPGLCEQLPWLGGVLRVYQQERHSDQSTAKYVAFVETLDVEPSQQAGELRLVLTSNNYKQGEVLLSFDFPSCEFPVRLPADESQVTLECYVDSPA